MSWPVLEGQEGLYVSSGHASLFYSLDSELFPISIYKMVILQSIFIPKSNKY